MHRMPPVSWITFRKLATNYRALLQKRPLKIRHPMCFCHPVSVATTQLSLLHSSLYYTAHFNTQLTLDNSLNEYTKWLHTWILSKCFFFFWSDADGGCKQQDGPHDADANRLFPARRHLCRVLSHPVREWLTLRCLIFTNQCLNLAISNLVCMNAIMSASCIHEPASYFHELVSNSHQFVSNLGCINVIGPASWAHSCLVREWLTPHVYSRVCGWSIYKYTYIYTYIWNFALGWESVPDKAAHAR